MFGSPGRPRTDIQRNGSCQGCDTRDHHAGGTDFQPRSARATRSVDMVPSEFMSVPVVPGARRLVLAVRWPLMVPVAAVPLLYVSVQVAVPLFIIPGVVLFVLRLGMIAPPCCCWTAVASFTVLGATGVAVWA